MVASVRRPDNPRIRRACAAPALARVTERELVTRQCGAWCRSTNQTALPTILAVEAILAGNGGRDYRGTGVLGRRQVLDLQAPGLAAGATHGQEMDVETLQALVEPLGRPLVQRSTLYQTM